MFEPNTVETAVVPRPFFATYMATRQLGSDVPDAASSRDKDMVGTPRTHTLVTATAGFGSGVARRDHGVESDRGSGMTASAKDGLDESIERVRQRSVEMREQARRVSRVRSTWFKGGGAPRREWPG